MLVSVNCQNYGKVLGSEVWGEILKWFLDFGFRWVCLGLSRDFSGVQAGSLFSIGKPFDFPEFPRKSHVNQLGIQSKNPTQIFSHPTRTL
jgi:hypothetical protein